jgi:Cyclopropane fatty acid synthase and related methyltransferases
MYYLNNIINLSIEKFALKFFEKTEYGSLSVEFPSGNISKFEGKEYGVSAKIKLKNFLLIKKIVKRGAIGFAESYMDGDFNTDDLKNLLIFAEKNKSSFLIYSKKKKLLNAYSKIKHYFKQNTISQARKNIKYHYDLGNKFYELWLDDTMTYSSGFFSKSDDDLHTSQINKYKKIIENININENSSLLEIGCGWGGFY